MPKRKKIMQLPELTRQDFLGLIRIETGEITGEELAREMRISKTTLYRRLKRMKVLDFKTYLNKIGVTDAALAKKIFEGLEATKVVGYLNNKIDGMQKVSDEFVEIPDMLTRHKYLVTALQLKGHLTQDEARDPSTSIIIQIVRPQIKDADTGGRISIQRALLAGPNKGVRNTL